jgi:saccharopine dehydrogenase-like NADP-dependent oxidoreductase
VKTVLVIGGTGYFGSLLVEELLQYSDCNILLGARKPGRLEDARQTWPEHWRQRTEIQELDLNVPASLAPCLKRVQVAVCAAGPFQKLPHTLLKACLESNIHYIDLADSRSFVREAHKLVGEITQDRACPVICSGWSAVPALSASLANIASENMDVIDQIRIQIAPGNRAPRSYGTVASLLECVGTPFRIWQNGSWATVSGWSKPTNFDFPLPIGRRQGYLVDVPDLELFPPLFKASTVEFRVGAEIPAFNQGCSLLAQIAKAGIVRNWSGWASLFQKAMVLVGAMGNDWGAVGVTCLGLKNGQAVSRKACVVATHHGHYIPVMPAAVMCTRLLDGELHTGGLLGLRNWLDRDQLDVECSRRNYRLVVE